MAANPNRLRGILKNPQDLSAAASSSRDIALQHARVLQHRKDLEAQILDSVILLSEFPLERDGGDPPYSAAHPALSDAATFKSHVRLFQPSDHDDLVEERNVNGLCGYALCGRPRRDPGRGGEWAFTSRGDIVKRRELGMWCSQDCKKRSLYVKVQLNETAAWERAGAPDIKIDLLDEEAAETDEDRAARKLGELKLEDQRQAARDSAVLALERGETTSNLQPDKVKVQLKEKDVKPPPDIADFGDDDDHMKVEGYKSKVETGAQKD